MAMHAPRLRALALLVVVVLLRTSQAAADAPNATTVERWRAYERIGFIDDVPGVRSRLALLPDVLYFPLPALNSTEYLRYSLNDTLCGGTSNVTFCLQSAPAHSWIGRISAHYPLGQGALAVTDNRTDKLTLAATWYADTSNIDQLGQITTMYVKLSAPLHTGNGALFLATRVELTFTCGSTLAPHFPVLESQVSVKEVEGVQTKVYNLTARHQCACASPQPQCSYFDSDYHRDNALAHWANAAEERSGRVTACMKGYTDDLSALWLLSLTAVLVLWGIDIFLAWPRFRFGRMSRSNVLAPVADVLDRARPSDSAYEYTLGSRFYVLCFGWMDVLTPPAHLLETSETSWPTATAFGAMSIIVPAFANNAMSISQLLIVLIFYMPLLMCRNSRTQALGLIMGAGYSLAVLKQTYGALACFSSLQSVHNIFALLPSTVCVSYLCAWYWWHTFKRFMWLYDARRGVTPPPPTWRQSQLEELNRSAYVKDLLARVPRSSLTPSFGWSAFKVTLRGDNHYSVPTRLLSAVVLSICFVLAIVPWIVSLAGLMGAAVEYGLSSGHCCQGSQCDPTPGSRYWIPDWLRLGVGMQVGHGEECTRDQMVLRNAMRYGMTSAAAIIGPALCLSLVHTLVVYRKRMLLLYKGRPDFIIKKVPVSETIGAALKYGGTQVASTLAALFLGTIVLALVSFFLTLSTVLPIMGLYGDWFWPWWFKFAIFDSTTMTLGFLATLIVNFWLLMFLARFAFRVSAKDHGLQRRGMFHIFDTVEFIFYILNALLGLIKRAITSIAFQVLFMGRMDKSLMPRKHELWDKSYVSYLGYMQLDMYYSHPVFLTAVYTFLKITAPAAAQRRSDVNIAQLRSSSGSWLRRTSSALSPLGNGSSMSLKSSAVFQALPSTSASRSGSPMLELRAMNGAKSSMQNDSPTGGGGRGSGSALGSSSSQSTTWRAKYRPGRDADDSDDDNERLVDETEEEAAGEAAVQAAAAAAAAQEAAAVKEVQEAQDASTERPTSPRIVSPKSLSLGQAAVAARRAAARMSGHARQVSIDSTVCVIVEETVGDRLRRRRTRNRWYLAYTLINNPILMYERRTFGVPQHLLPKRFLYQVEGAPSPPPYGSDGEDPNRDTEVEEPERRPTGRSTSRALLYGSPMGPRKLVVQRTASNPFAVDGFNDAEAQAVGNTRSDSLTDAGNARSNSLSESETETAKKKSKASRQRGASANTLSVPVATDRPQSFAEFAEEDMQGDTHLPDSEA